jgi:hypothetical protein
MWSLVREPPQEVGSDMARLVVGEKKRRVTSSLISWRPGGRNDERDGEI